MAPPANPPPLAVSTSAVRMLHRYLMIDAAFERFTAAFEQVLSLIGNPLTAINLTRHKIRAALCALLRVLVYERTPGHTSVEYDQPSCFDNAGIDRSTGKVRETIGPPVPSRP